MLLHRFFIQNDSVWEVGAFQPNTGIEIYEVIRVIKEVPLFLRDHLKRFFHSAWLCHLDIPVSEEIISSRLSRLIDENNVEEGNIRFSYCFRPAGNFQAYFIPHHYPGEADVQNGIVCGILPAVRNDPNAKVVQANLREAANQMMEEKGYYEILLVNQQPAFTEGSRSNLFFLQKGTFVTSPSGDVLPGVTRQKVLDLLHKMDKKVTKKNLLPEELIYVEAAFITGTSPKVLPIRKIEGYSFKTDLPEIRELIDQYDRLIEQYIEIRKTG